MSTRTAVNFLPVVVIALIFGSMAIWWGISSVCEGYASSTWPQTTGAIQDSRIGQPGVSTRGNISPYIIYDYTVDGHAYRGSKVDTRGAWNFDKSYQIVHNYPVGSRPPVYYSPSNPGNSILLPGLHRSSFFGIILGTLIFTFGGIFGAIGYLAPKYGKTSSGRVYTFDDDSPVVPVVWIGFIAIACQFGLLFWTCN